MRRVPPRAPWFRDGAELVDPRQHLLLCQLLPLDIFALPSNLPMSFSLGVVGWLGLMFSLGWMGGSLSLSLCLSLSWYLKEVSGKDALLAASERLGGGGGKRIFGDKDAKSAALLAASERLGGGGGKRICRNKNAKSAALLAASELLKGLNKV